MAKMGHNNPPISGYVLIARKLLNHPIVGAGKPVKPAKPNKPTYSRMEAWLDLLMMASYQDKKTKIGGKLYQLETGEAVCARAYLAVRWNWTDKTVRAFIERLMHHSMVTKTRETKGQQANKLSICNYSDYQRPNQEMGQVRGQQKGQQKGQQEIESTYCNKTINLFDDDCKGQSKGPTEGPQSKETKINKKTPSEQKKEGGYSEEENRDIQTAFEEYNQLAKSIGLSKAISLNATRKKHLAARLKEHGLDGWRLGLDLIDQSKFLCGTNNRGYKANLDFMLQASSYTKLLEGFYRKDQPRRSQRSAKNSEWEKLKAKYAAPPPIIREDAR